MKRRDLIVLGGGSAGHAAARTASDLGLDTALVEKPGPLGGLCILRGCMPSKTLIATADRMREVRQASEFAVRAGQPELDFPALKSRLDQVIGGFIDHREAEMKDAPYALIRGQARFTDDHTLALDSGETLSARAFVIAAGSTPTIPDIPGLDATPFWTSDEVTRLPSFPGSIAIIGTGAVGMECAHLFEGLGSEVTVLARSAGILHHFHPEVGRTVEAAGRERGIRTLFETEATRVDHDGHRFHVQLSTGQSLRTDALLVATGRHPATAALDLEKAGIECEDGRIRIDEHAATNREHVFAAGDCASPLAVVHVAVMQGQTAARNAARLLKNSSRPRASWHSHLGMQAVFTRPEAISIGLDPAPEEMKGRKLREQTYRFADEGKGEILGIRHGYVRIISEKDGGRIVGAHAVGPGVIDSAHVMQLAVGRGMTVTELLETPFYHPTLVEIWTYAAEES
ncbi:dihydrolipoyl dehydrogenase family protein [Haloferula sargassicola]|uniref:Mercuric reductase n=1 Tax=Haloferula sargassicola TaxID=490096 RepID=A0ABP9ULY6_9BACT